MIFKIVTGALVLACCAVLGFIVFAAIGASL